MDAVCLLVAGVIRATLAEPEFTLAWDHSVQKTRWEEHYRVAGTEFELDAVRIQGSGAGMEAPPEAVLHEGWWTWRPATRLAELRLARSPYAGDYLLCQRDRCRPIADFVGPATGVAELVIRPCNRSDRTPH